MLLLNGTNGRLSHVMAAPTGYPYVTVWQAKLAYSGTNQTVFSEVQVAAGRNIKLRAAFNAAGSALNVQSLTTWGATPDGNVSEDLGTGGDAGAEPIMLVHNSATSIKAFTKNNSSGVTYTGTNGSASEFANADTLLLGALYIDGAYADYTQGSVGELARVHGAAFGSTEFASILAGTPVEQIPLTDYPGASLYEVWDLNPAVANGTAITTDLIGLINGRLLTPSGGVTKSSLTHPVTRSSSNPKAAAVYYRHLIGV